MYDRIVASDREVRTEEIKTDGPFRNRMKHNWSVTLVLLALYLVSHLTGLFLIGYDMEVMEQDGERTPEYEDTTIGQRPAIQGFGTLLYIGIGVGIGTAALLLLMRFKQYNLWKFWFFTASFLAMSLALGVPLPSTIAFLIGFCLALGKILTQNTVVHNVSEVLMYAGIAVFFAPLLNVWWGILLLVAFSLYDAYAVWQTEHMVEMAKFQSETVFAGLNLPYDDDGIRSKKTEISTEKTEDAQVQEQESSGPRSAILGGGDIAVPLLFSAAVMEFAVRNGATKLSAFLQGTLVSVASAGTLLALFYYSEDDAFYPAMPFITGGCLVGFAVVFLFQ